MTNNKSVLAWLDEMKELVTPDEVVWIDGSEEQLESLRKQACETGEMIKLNQEKLPGCYLHRTAINDVARVEGRHLHLLPQGRGRWPHQPLDGTPGRLQDAVRHRSRQLQGPYHVRDPLLHGPHRLPLG